MCVGGMHGRESMCGWGHVFWGACMAEEAYMAVGHACMVGEIATLADSMHPTGTHSCTRRPLSRRPSARLPIDVWAT